MIQVEVPARGRILFHDRLHGAKRGTKHVRNNYDARSNDTAMLGELMERTTVVPMATGPQLHHVRHGELHSAMLSLWSHCRFSAKGNEGTLLGCLLVVSTLTFVVFAAFTLYFTQCQLRE